MVDTLIRPVVREDLIREAVFRTRDADTDQSTGDGFTIAGHGAVFNVRTTIDSWEGAFEEEIHPGAFKRTLRNQTPMMQYDHGRHPLIGSIPLGVWTTAQEDDQGVWVEGRITDNWLMQPVRDAIENGGVKGMSFRFSVVRETWVDQAGTRIKPEDVELALWAPDRLGYEVALPLVRQLKEVRAPEIGPVAWPAYVQTDVGVRSLPGLDVADGRRVVIDLARLDSPAMRATLARAVFLADNAERQHVDGSRHDSDLAPDAPADPEPIEGAEEPATDVHRDSDPGEHPSPVGNAVPIDIKSRRAKILAVTRSCQSYVTSLEDEPHGQPGDRGPR